MRIGKTVERQTDRLKVNLGFRLKPRYLNFITTKKCQSRCTYCDIWKLYKNNPKALKDEMNYDEIHDFVSRDEDFLNKLEFVQITGGEPFLRDDIPQIANLFYETSPRLESLWIPSNGLSGNKVLRQVEEMVEDPNVKRFGISISIDGKKNYHDKVRGRKGFFGKTMKTLDRLVQIKENHTKLELSLGFTIGKDNWQDLIYVYSLSKDKGVDFTARPVNFSEVYYLNSDSKEDSGMTENEIEKVSDMLDEILKDKFGENPGRKSLNTRAYFQGIATYLRNPGRRFFPCYSGALSLGINQVGDAFPCLYMSEKLGNVRKTPLETIWKSKKARNVWKRIKNNKCPNCWVECESQKNITYEMPWMLLGIRNLSG